MVKLPFWSYQKSEDIEKEIRNRVRLIESNFKDINIIGTNDEKDHDDADDDIEIWFSQTVFDEVILSALEKLFSVLFQARQEFLARPQYEEPGFISKPIKRPIIISRLQLDRCEGNQYADKCIKLALEYDVVEVLCVDGQVGSYDLLQSSPLVCPTSFPIHLKELDLRYFQISAQDICMLRNGILNPALRNAGGGLERLSCCNIAFQDDHAVQEFAQVLSQLSQKPKNYNSNNGRFLETLWLYYCNLTDRHLETIMKSLITVNVATNNNYKTWYDVDAVTVPESIRQLSLLEQLPFKVRGIEYPTTTPSGNAASPVNVVESTLKSLTIEQASCGAPFYGLLGAWLMNSFEREFLPPTIRSLCSLETVNIFIWEAVQTRTSTDPIEPLTRSLPWSNTMNNDSNNDDSNKTTTTTTNTILKKLCLSGVDNMEYLGRFVSEHLLGLESLQLHSHGSTDEGMIIEKFSRFVSASRRKEENRNHKQQQQEQEPRNYVLRELSCHCSDKPTRLKLESCYALENLLDRYPMLHDVKFGFKRNAYARQQEGEPSNTKVQQMKNVNAGGRFLFVPTENRPTGLPISLWPIVLAEFHKRNRVELDSLMDEDLQRWVESGSIGGDDMDDDLDSELEDDENDDDDNMDDNNSDEVEAGNVTMNFQPTKSSNEDPRVMEKTASAIYGLLRPNMERIRLMRLEQQQQQKQLVASSLASTTQQILQSSSPTGVVKRPSPVPRTVTDSESVEVTSTTMVDNSFGQNKRRKILLV